MCRRLHALSYSLHVVLRRLAPLLVATALLFAWAGQAGGAPAPPVAAKAVLVGDGKTGEILFERNAEARVPMASITKLMTALVTLENRRPDDVVTVHGPAPSIGESTIQLRAGEKLPVGDLLAAALIQSANDAAYALASEVGDGSVPTFVALMNAKARELGLADTRYARPDGLDTPAHYSSAEDTFALARTAMARPVVRRLVRMRRADIAGGRTVRTWNDLLATFPGLNGVKTGHTDRAGWSEVASARRDGTNVYAVILGRPNRAQRNADLAKLLEWGFDQYGRVTFIREGQRYATTAVPFSEERVELVALGSADDVIRLRPGTRFEERVVAPAMVDLPVRRGQRLGEVIVTDGDRVVARQPLVATRSVAEPSFGDRVGWYADRTLDEAGSMLANVFGAIG